jgi:hypothetical protein
MSATGVAELTGLPTYSHTAAVAFRARRALLWIVPLALAALLSGCAGTVSPKNSQTNVPPPPAQTFGVSGTINPTAGGSGATVTLSGAASATTTANSSGAYNFTGLANGTYAVTPSHSGYTFSPSVQPATINGANITGLNFTATQVSAAQAHSVSLSWDASPSTVSGYNVYRSIASGSGFARVNASLVGGLSYVDTTVQAGTMYFYVTRAVDSSGDESANSNQVSAAVP